MQISATELNHSHVLLAWNIYYHTHMSGIFIKNKRCNSNLTAILKFLMCFFNKKQVRFLMSLLLKLQFQTVFIANKNSLRLCVITAMFSAVTLKTNK